jgi:hypothetical protein
MLNFILGLALGFFAGVAMMCILFVAREKKKPDNKGKETTW